MKILVVSHYYASHGGGIESVIRQLLLAFREAAPRHRFTWAATACDTPMELPAVTNLPMAGTNGIERRTGIPLPLWSFKALRELAAAVREHDAVWLHDTLYAGNIAAYLIARRAGKPVIITQHIGNVPYKNQWLRRAVAAANRCIALPMLRHAFQTVFIAAHVRNFFLGQGGVWPTPPVFIPNGVQHSIFKTVGAERRAMLRQKFNLADNPAILFIGRFVAKKGLAIMEQLARAMPDVSFLFAGKGPLDPAAWRLGNVQVMRDRTGAAVAELYQAADLLVLPSAGEGLPLVIQEAAACGLPILCAGETAQADPALPQLINTAPLNFAAPEATAQHWQKQLADLLANPALLQAQGETLAAFARNHWSWQQAVLHYDAIFARIPKPPPPPEEYA